MKTWKIILACVFSYAVLALPAGAAPLPLPQTLPADNITTNSATLHGASVWNKKQPGFVAFQIRKQGARWPAGHTPWQRIARGQTNVVFAANVTALKPGTNYQFRAVRYIAGLTRYGTVLGFAMPARPAAVTSAAINISSNSAILTATVDPNGLPTDWAFEWVGPQGGSYQAGGQTNGSDPVLVQLLVTNLPPNSSQSFRVSAGNDAGLSIGAFVAFTTPPISVGAPLVQTAVATGIITNSATLNGNVNPNGLASTAWFEWGLTTNYGNSTVSVSLPVGANVVPMQAPLTNLTPGTTYHFRVMATNTGGVSVGGDLAFATRILLPPTIATVSVTGITTNAATLNGGINPNGLASFAWFQWGTTTNYGNITGPVNLGLGTNVVSMQATLVSLSPGAAYHFRVVATNSAGVSSGSDVGFAALSTGSVTVTNGTDAELRAAVAGFSTVLFDFDGVIDLTNTLVIDASVQIDGSGHSVTLSGGGSNRLFIVKAGATLSMIDLTLANGRVQGTNAIYSGGLFGNPGESVAAGGMLVSNATLMAQGCVFSNCAAIGGWGNDPPFGGNPMTRGPGGAATGGAILAVGSSVVLTNCTFAGNAATAGWSGYWFWYDPSRAPGNGAGGAIASSGSGVILIHCLFNNNSATTSGGAIDSSGASSLSIDQAGFNSNSGNVNGGAVNVGGGNATIIRSDFTQNASVADSSYSTASGGAFSVLGGSVKLLDCNFVGNICYGRDVAVTPYGGWPATAGRGGAIITLGGSTSLSRSTFRGNLVGGGSGAASGSGGALYNAASVNLTNCTFAGNHAIAGGGPGASSAISGGGAIENASGDTLLVSTTIASNLVSDTIGSNSFGGGIHLSGGTVSILNSLLAGNLANTNADANVNGALTDLGHNLSSDATPVWTFGTSLNNTDPLLGPLSDNGGFTLTFPLLPGSPAIDAADPLLAPATDQRGVARPQGPAPDIGSYER